MKDRWVCLMYHDIASAGNSLPPGRAWFAVAVETFRRQLDLIRDTGMAGCSLAEAQGRRGPRVAITFDDGVRSDYEVAFPELLERAMTATFFVVTARIGTRGHVTWDELRTMHAAGMSIQSHSHSHPFLSELSAESLRKELVESKARLDDALGQATDELALPGGDAPRPRFRHVVVEAGYRVVATSRWGTNAPHHPSRQLEAVRRCTIAGAPPEALFRRILAGDRRVALRRRAREIVLGSVRWLLGPSRYAAWRARFVDAAQHP